MLNKYIRKQHTPNRAVARELSDAVDDVKNGDMDINEAAKAFEIAKTTFTLLIKTNNMNKINRLGPD
ncbi:unnamed protein product [Diabrotica balteata]|uniref:HTH psq-type domain-containing protein n=1 Tax=Diabrotica balteata TaxID=107213 RepID=A0A9N9SP87_DIABA|nr:unnamed protein product [Diabrotica balteata]